MDSRISMDIPRSRKRRSTSPLSSCEHVQQQLSPIWASLNGPLLSESLRYSRLDCGCDEFDGDTRLCLVCGVKLCAVHSLRSHVKETQHSIMMDIVSLQCECTICDKSNLLVEGLADALVFLQEAHVSIVTSGFEPGLRGLHNAGNTCFMNSVWQALSHTSDFRESILQYVMTMEAAENGILLQQHQSRAPPPGISINNGNGKVKISSSLPPPSSMFHAWSHLLARLWQEDLASLKAKNVNLGGPVDPNDLFNLVKTSIPIFGDARQHDAHEFLRFFSDSLQAEQSWAMDVFGGSLLSEVSCLRCNVVTRKVDPCLDISLDIPVDTLLSVVLHEGKPLAARPLRLHDCLKRFVQLEHIARGNDDACKVCVSSGQNGNGTPEVVATKRLRLLSMPKVLVIHFKRFKWSFYENSVKIARYVQFPLRGLTLKEFRAKDSQGSAFSDEDNDESEYDLCSVVVHHGRSIGNGHYTTYSLNSTDRRWYHYNDTMVTPVDDEVVARSEAYLLFYQKRPVENDQQNVLNKVERASNQEKPLLSCVTMKGIAPCVDT